MSVPPAAPGPVAPEQLLTLATDVATRAARLLLEAQGRERTSVQTKSTRTDMVSEMDRASELLIVSELLAVRSDDGIVGEEGSDRAGISGLRWVVDPLDGTTNYLYGFPGWSVSIAAEDDDGVVAGVVVDPSHRDVFSATRGGGARRNGEPIACSAQTVLAETLVGTGFNYAADAAAPPGRGARRPAAAGARHPAHGGGVGGPVLGGLRPPGRLLRTRAFPGGTSPRVVSLRRKRAPLSPP